MTIQITYNKPKVLQALRYHFISRKEIKVLLILVNVFAVTSAILFYFHKILPLAFMIGSFLWFALMLTFWFFLPRIVYRKSNTFLEKITLQFFAQGMELSTQRGQVMWAYNKFSYYIESPFFFHLYINERSFFLLPKEACVEQTDTVQMRSLLDDKIGRKK